ncbi:hypothetical protein ACFUAC_19600 [Streptomyces sp. NPDC057148]
MSQYVRVLEIGGEKDYQPLEVPDRPAVLSSDHTMQITVGSGGSSGPVE